MPPSRNSARMTPPIVPRPPKIETPPSSTAVTTVSSNPTPTFAAAVELRSEMTTPASAATAPERTNSRSLIRLTRRPEKNAASSLAPIAKTERPNGVKCSSTAKSTARTANSTMTFGTAVPAKLPNARSVQTDGKSVTESSPMTTNARPRNRASVPIVTASDGRPSRVTSRPLNAPHSPPATMQIGMISSSGRPPFHSAAMSALDSPSTEAIDRSISAAITTRVNGSAMSAISEKSSEPVVNESLVRNSGEIACPIGSSRTNSATSSASQRPRSPRQAPPSRRSKPGSASGAARAPSAAGGTVDVVGSAGTADAPSAQAGVDAQADEAVEGDRDEQQRADGGLLPERVDLQDDQRRRDRVQEQCAERGAVHAAGAAEDRDAADHGGRDDRELVAGAGGRVHGAEAGGEQDAGQPGERARQQERDEHAALRANAGEPGALGVRADRVQLAAGAEVAQRLADDDHDDEREQRERRDSEARPRAEIEERVRQRLGVHLTAVRPQEREAAERVERAQRDDERGHLPERHEDAVEHAAGGAEEDAEQHDDNDRHARVRGQEVAGHEGGEPEHRADRQVDVAGDDDERLAGGEDREDRRVQREVAQRVGVDEPRLDDRGHRDERDERDDDAELAHPEDELREAPRAGAGGLGGGALRGQCFGAHAASRVWPVAARMTLSSSACSRVSSPVSRPSCMTSTRSAMPRTSGSSLEIIRTASP